MMNYQLAQLIIHYSSWTLITHHSQLTTHNSPAHSVLKICTGLAMAALMD